MSPKVIAVAVLLSMHESYCTIDGMAYLNICRYSYGKVLNHNPTVVSRQEGRSRAIAPLSAPLRPPIRSQKQYTSEYTLDRDKRHERGKRWQKDAFPVSDRHQEAQKTVERLGIEMLLEFKIKR